MTELVKSVNCVKYRFENISYFSVEASHIVVRADTNEIKLKKHVYFNKSLHTDIYISLHKYSILKSSQYSNSYIQSVN